VKDVIIIGSGPAGLAVADTLMRAGIDLVIYEKGALVDAISRFPMYMRWFSTTENLELGGMPLTISDEKPTREEYLTYLRRFVVERKIPVVTDHRVINVERLSDDSGFRVSGEDQWHEPFSDEGRFVVIATGGFDHPQMLGVPGEDLQKVSHYFTEVHPYAGKKVLVVGGRTSAVETALLLWRAGSEVTLVHRGPALVGLKYWMAPDIENRINAGQIRALFYTTVIEIRRHDVVLRTKKEPPFTLENDYVLAMTGFEPNVRFLENLGIAVHPHTKCPTHNSDTLETNMPGIYVAGVITSGSVSGKVFIENSRVHGEMILKSIQEKLARGMRN
jgi:thioredoxin reductase (NADPH)